MRTATIDLSAKLERINPANEAGSGSVFSQIDYVLAYR